MDYQDIANKFWALDTSASKAQFFYENNYSLP